ncbi:hypothetical protein [Streptococcus pseudopneumoniae]|uniref:hypothetical protein n=1 Tax=Streptococcus pseudopneumoniae TaxID=257758 RepID=UPI0009B9B38E|nr:hypothetical protein [Streptococcus pseudopneumoniae]
MKKVLLTSAVALAAFGAVQAVSADDSYATLIKDALGVKAGDNGNVDDAVAKVKALQPVVNTLRKAHSALQASTKAQKTAEEKLAEAQQAYSDAVKALRDAKLKRGDAEGQKAIFTDLRTKVDAKTTKDSAELATKKAELGEKEGTRTGAYLELDKAKEALDNAQKAVNDKYDEKPLGGDVEATKKYEAEKLKLESALAKAQQAYSDANEKVSTLEKEVKELDATVKAEQKDSEKLKKAINALTTAIADGTGLLEEGQTFNSLEQVTNSKYAAVGKATDDLLKADKALQDAKADYEKAEKDAKDKYKEQKVAFVLEDVIKADTPTPAAVVKFGWNKDTKGNWTYVVDSKGTKAAGWINDQGTWYYLNTEGVMQTGWVKDNGTWYYLKSSGAMATGWVKDNGTWYYLKSSGAMATGWYQVGGNWYYSYASGALAVSTTTPDGYTVNANGEWV